jgi:hypothetical protein
MVVVYLIGFWPEHRKLVSSRAEVARLQEQLTEAQDKVVLGEILGHLLHLQDTLAARNYGEAAAVSSALFDRTRQEVSRTTRPESKQALEQILQTRDQVTTAIARSDSAATDLLRSHMLILRRALGFQAR